MGKITIYGISEVQRDLWYGVWTPWTFWRARVILLCVFKKFSHAGVVTGALVLHQGRTTYKVQNSPRGFGNFWFNLRDKIMGRECSQSGGARTPRQPPCHSTGAPLWCLWGGPDPQFEGHWPSESYSRAKIWAKFLTQANNTLCLLTEYKHACNFIGDSSSNTVIEMHAWKQIYVHLFAAG